MSDVTQLLERWQSGDKSAENELFNAIYPVIHRMARSQISGARGKLTLQVTELVGEAYERLAQQKRSSWNNREHFYAVAAQVLRRVLIDYLREHGAQKRGRASEHVELDLALEIEDPQPAAFDWLTLDRVLMEFEQEEPEHARLVELRYFAGMSIEQAAVAMDVSPATVSRMWRYARAWLTERMAA